MLHRRLVFLLSLISLCSGNQPLATAKRNSFTMDLIHRDSLLLSKNNYSIISLTSLWREAVLRSFSQANCFNSSMNFDAKGIVESDIVQNGADYLMRFFLQNKTYEVLALASTGSDLIWINCNPCQKSYKQNKPLFEPNMLTYNVLLHTDKFCRALKNTEEIGRRKICKYRYYYQKGGFTVGFLSTDEFYLNSEDEDFTKLVFGCSHKTMIRFEGVVQGMIGLGWGKLSLISQLIDNQIIKPVFSYCLVPRSRNIDINSKIRFGEREREENTNVGVSTPIRSKLNLPFYYITLTGFSIGGETQVIWPYYRDIIIDSGVAMTVLHSNIYDPLESMIKDNVGIEPTSDPSKTFKLCFEKTQLIDKTLPEIVFHLGGGDLHLKNENMFVDWYAYKCLAIAPYDGISIIGNTAQIDFLVEYDLEINKVSFTPTDCTKSP